MVLQAEIREFLGELGLNPVETAVYVAALELGSGPASAIALAAGLNRITAYEALKRLSKKGLVKIRAKKNDGVKYFVPEDVSIIIERLSEKKKELEQKIEHAEALKDKLRARFRFDEQRPEVLFYEGEEGIRKVLQDTLRQKPKEIVSLSSIEAVRDGFTMPFVQQYWDKRVSMGIPSRGIIQMTPEALQAFPEEKNKKELRAVRFLPPELYQFKNEIDIYGDSVGITSHEKGNMHGIVIRSRSIADSMRAVFETLWKLSEHAE